MPCPSLRPPSILQELTPPQARFCLDAARFLTRDLNIRLKGCSLLIAFSGGADSTALLLCMRCLAPSFNLTLAAAHLDHGLRPSSAREAEHCAAFCRELGIPCVNERRDIAGQRLRNKTGLEEEGRLARYDFFAKQAKRLGCDWILTAHQNNDLAEDLLMRLIRGAGWPAVSGMPAADETRKLLRPLLLTPRREIENFLLSLGIDWLHDESNSDSSRLRNRIRGELLPLFLRENPAFLNTVAGLWRLGRIDEAYFNECLSAPDRPATGFSDRTLPEKNPPSPLDPPATLVTPAATLTALPQALRLRLYKKALACLGPGQALLSSLLRLDRSWLSGNGRTTHRFPGGKNAQVDGTGIVWRKDGGGEA